MNILNVNVEVRVEQSKGAYWNRRSGGQELFKMLNMLGWRLHLGKTMAEISAAGRELEELSQRHDRFSGCGKSEEQSAEVDTSSQAFGFGLRNLLLDCLVD